MAALPESYANNILTTLNGAIDSSQTSIVVTSAAGFPTTGQYRVLIDAEILLVTGGQGTTTWTVTRHVESSTTQSHSDLAIVRFIITAQSLRELQWKDKIIIPTNVGHILDDDFDDGVLDSAWVRVDNSGDAADVTWTEFGDVLSMRNVGADAATRYHALLKPLGSLSYPITIEGAMRHFSTYAVNYFMLGVGFADGTTYGAGKQITTRSYTNSSLATALTLSCHSVTGFDTEVGGSDVWSYQTMGGPWFWRLIWSAANTFQAWVSPDGVSWIQFITDLSYTITPTHFGIFTSNWSGLHYTVGTIEYIRIFESNKAGNP